MNFRVVVLLITTIIFVNCSKGQDQNQLLSLEDKIGQMLLIGFRGKEVKPQDAIIDDVKTGRVGGVILFDYDVQLKVADRNIKSPDQVKALVSDIKTYAKTPLFIAIDQEGGRVNRLKTNYGFPNSVSAQYLGGVNNLDTTSFYAEITANTLSELGINLNFSPVVDLNTNPDNPVIGKIERSYGADGELVMRHAMKVIEAHRKRKIINSLKHFPGHGSAWNDSHFGIADVSETWNEQELFPYRQLIAEKQVDMVMTAHIYNRQLDADYPATLSKNVLTDLLRKQLKFDGVIVSDDMQMDAIDEQYGLEMAISQAINAGVDILVFGNNLNYDPKIASKAITIIKSLVQRGKISEQRIDESYQRIIKLKKLYIE